MGRNIDNWQFVKEVQSDLNLHVDGWAGPNTRAAWHEFFARPAVAPVDVDGTDRSLRLPLDQYLPDTQVKKNLIILHHTSGGSAKSTFDWWRTTPERIGTAYIVERDGRVFEVFPPESWAYHLGIKGTGGSVDRRAIGIEIASEGGLIENDKLAAPDGKLYAFGTVSKRTEFRGSVLTLPNPWRGFRYFADYTPAALSSVFNLVKTLLRRFDIPRFVARGDAADLDFAGVAGHCHFRRDKSDVHPGFPWAELAFQCDLQISD